MKVIKLWFADECLFILTDKKEELKQSLKFYPLLKNATDEQRSHYRVSAIGLHWPDIDEDISFESFGYDAESETTENTIATVMHRLPELNATQLAKRLGIPQSVFASYICGAKKPSEKRKKEIANALHDLGQALLSVKL